MQILIIGLSHQIQAAQIKSWSSGGQLEAFERAQKDHFAVLVRSNVLARGIQLIAEEARHEDLSIAEEVCSSIGINYLNVEMTPEERREREIPPGYNEDPDYPAAEKERGNRTREEYMVVKILGAADKPENVLLICGLEHMNLIAEQLCHHGHKVECMDLTKEPWYVDDWAEHMRSL